MLGFRLWVQTLRYDLFSVVFFLLGLGLLILSLSLLGLGSRLTFFSTGFCVRSSRQYETICGELDLFPGFFVSSWMVVWADGVNGSGWCLAGGRACWLKDPKCKLNIFLTPTYPLDCLICAKDIMIIVLLLQIMGGLEGWGDGSFMLGFRLGDRWWVP